MPDLKPELSKDNKYWIPKHRYYELKHYCLQYPDWKTLYFELEYTLKAHENQEVHTNELKRLDEEFAVKRLMLFNAMWNVESCVKDCTDVEVLQSYILKAVTEGLPYSQLKAKYDVPCGQDMYYDIYRKFFWLLSRKRGI